MASWEKKRQVYQIRDRLNAVSPSFCLAKWLQVTMHLHSGHNHSCHHPAAHKTPLEELKIDPSALHNTCFKKEQRLKMLSGARPAECQYCWNIEDLSNDHLSDRTMKSSEFWAAPDLDKIASLSANQNINPTYAEISFSNVCNFRCSYCSSDFSTRWQDDIRRHGHYTTNSGMQTMDILDEENNPYIKAFWEWWPQLRNDLKVFRITGGEPLLSKNTFRVLESILENPLPNLEVAVNSNLGVPATTVDKMVDLARKLEEKSAVGNFRMFTSLDAWGRQAEYTRDGLNLELFQRNLETILTELPRTQITIMSTFNALSPSTFFELLRYVRLIKKKFGTRERLCPLFIDVSYLRHPSYQTAQILPKSYLAYMQKALEFMETHKTSDENPTGFYPFEMIKVKRTVEWMSQEVGEADLNQKRKEFYSFFSEHDKRRGTSFLESFPEMEDFWNQCKSLHSP